MTAMALGLASQAKAKNQTMPYPTTFVSASEKIGVCLKKKHGCFLSHLLVAGCDIGVRFSVRPSVNIYVDVRHLCQS